LRERENKAFDDTTWYRFGRHQNINKQEDRKLIVAQTVKKARWAKEERSRQIELATLSLQDRLRIGSSLVVEYFKGELRILDEGIALLDAIFVAPEEAAQIAIHWRQVLRDNPVTESTLAARLASALRRVRHTPNKALASQIAELDRELRDLEHDISKAEKDLNTVVRALYALTTEEAAILQPAPT